MSDDLPEPTQGAELAFRLVGTNPFYSTDSDRNYWNEMFDALIKKCDALYAVEPSHTKDPTVLGAWVYKRSPKLFDICAEVYLARLVSSHSDLDRYLEFLRSIQVRLKSIIRDGFPLSKQSSAPPPANRLTGPNRHRPTSVTPEYTKHLCKVREQQQVVSALGDQLLWRIELWQVKAKEKINKRELQTALAELTRPAPANRFPVSTVASVTRRKRGRHAFAKVSERSTILKKHRIRRLEDVLDPNKFGPVLPEFITANVPWPSKFKLPHRTAGIHNWQNWKQVSKAEQRRVGEVLIRGLYRKGTKNRNSVVSNSNSVLHRSR